ncbi:hypothetical protein GG344DRAFT_83661 [Lentinula edodes]|nr:hypothetical protein GG344DRAFT_83661 [Lentinula edodes]KAJ3911932.1 hypothetical protein F5877DRAFT_72800 [Lentinula edodes]
MSSPDPSSLDRPPISRSLGQNQEEPYEDMIRFAGPTKEELDNEIAYRELDELILMEEKQALTYKADQKSKEMIDDLEQLEALHVIQEDAIATLRQELSRLFEESALEAQNIFEAQTHNGQLQTEPFSVRTHVESEDALHERDKAFQRYSRASDELSRASRRATEVLQKRESVLLQALGERDEALHDIIKALQASEASRQAIKVHENKQSALWQAGKVFLYGLVILLSLQVFVGFERSIDQ